MVQGSLEESLEKCSGNQIKKCMLSVRHFLEFVGTCKSVGDFENIYCGYLKFNAERNRQPIKLGGGGGCKNMHLC